MKIEIYSKPACPFCDKALFLAQQVCDKSEQGFHTYDKYMLDVDFTREELFEQFPTARTFPQIRIRETENTWTYIGGYTEFEAFIKENKY
jgi:glutaredoxin 3